MQKPCHWHLVAYAPRLLQRAESTLEATSDDRRYRALHSTARGVPARFAAFHSEILEGFSTKTSPTRTKVF